MMRWVSLALVLAVSPALAQPVYPVRPIEGYVCAHLALSEREAMDFRFSVPIRVEPSIIAPVGTTASSVLLLKSPRHEVSGFLEVLQLTGKPGWIEADRVQPFGSRCQPAVLSNGRIGFG